MNSGYFSIGEIRRFAATVGVAAVSLLFALDVSAQNQIPDFIENQGLTNTNLGRSALAVQRIQMVSTGKNFFASFTRICQSINLTHQS